MINFINSRLSRFLMVVLLTLSGQLVLAQSSGSISGRIADPNGASLPGAQISIPALGLRTSSNAQGEFTLTGVPAGTQSLQVNYLGLEPQTQTINVTGGQRTVANFTLVPAGMEELVVRGAAIRDATARALNQQRMADNTTNVISADSIGKFPDPNIAEALQRTAGIAIERDQGEGRYINIRGAPSEFTAVSIDGISMASPDPGTRAIDLDTVPSDIVSQIEVTKSLLPEQDADSIAGAVNIVTQSPFDSAGMVLRGMAGGSYNKMGGNDVRGNFVASNLFNEGTLGALFSASYSRTDRRVDNVETEWTKVQRPEGGEVWANVENLFKDYDTRRERFAFTGVMDFRPSDVDRVFARGSYARFEDDEYRNRLSIIWDDGTLQPGASDGVGTWANTRIEKQFRHRVQRNELSSLAIGGEHDRDTLRFDYTAAYSLGKQTYPSRNELLWRSSLRPTLTYNYTNNPNLPEISLFNSGEHLQVNSYSFRENTFRSQDTKDEEFSLASNMELFSTMGEIPMTWKFGLKWRGKEKTADNEQWRNRAAAAAPSQPLSAFLSDKLSDNYDYALGNKMDPAVTRAYLDAAARTDAQRRISNSITADYEVQEDIYAGYSQAKMEFGNSNVIFGLRVENTRINSFAPEFDGDTETVLGEGSARTRYTDFFPSVNVRHEFNDNLIGRAAFTRGISRPSFPDIVPRVVESDSGSVRPLYTLGNPDLNPALANNFDLGLEYYIMPLGLVSGNVFYKDLKDYQYTLTLDGTYQGGNARLSQPLNAPDGYARGFEVSWWQQFDMLPDWMSGFGIFANYTYTDAEMELGRTYAGRDTFSLAGQSKNNYNVALFYEVPRFNARISYTDRSDYLTEINADDADSDLYWQGRGQLDFTASYDVTDNWNVFLEAKNLTNTAGVRYFGSRDRVYEYEKFGYMAFAGVKFNY